MSPDLSNSFGAFNGWPVSDPDNPPLTDAELQQFKRGRGRPQGSGKKEQVTLRQDAEILEQFRATGNGWQTRINDALRDWTKHHWQGANREPNVQSCAPRQSVARMKIITVKRVEEAVAKMR